MAYQNRQNMHDLFKDNIHQAEGDRDRKYHERQQQLNEERASIEVLNRQLAEEERMNKAKKEAIRNAQYQEYANYFNANIAKHFPATTTTAVNHIEQDPMYNDYMQLYIEITNRDTGDSERGTVLDCYKTPAWLDGLIKMFEEDFSKQ